jgi:Phosphomannomutase
MSMTSKSLYELKSGMTRYPQVLINVPLPFKVDLDSYDEIKQAVQAAEEELGESGRVLLRPSGTEPVVRVMVEGRVASDVERICNRIATAVNDAVSA